MDLLNLILLFGIMLVLAAVPSTSAGLVVTRSATHGLRSGLAASMGIVVADLVFVLLAILGMAALAELLGAFFLLVRILAAGFFLTLGDVKAIVFYASLFPAFVDLTSLTLFQGTAIVSLTVLAVGGIKALYAIGARTMLRPAGFGWPARCLFRIDHETETAVFGGRIDLENPSCFTWER